jgi:hypothetical protein
VIGLAFALLAAAAPPASGVPRATDVVAAIRSVGVLSRPLVVRPHRLRGLRCAAHEEEPTEFTCRFSAPDRRGRWWRVVAVMALEDGRWTLIDGLDIAP